MTPFTPPAAPVPMPVVKPPRAKRSWGIRMGGVGGPLEDLINQHASRVPVDRPYTLIEIGSAGCVSLRSFKDILSEARGAAPWRVVGFDLTEDKAWSLDWDQIRAAFDGVPHILREGTDLATYSVNQMYLMLLADPRSYLATTFPFEIDFAFIDGSHGKSAGRDFLAIEHKIAPGGVVVFHDYGEPEQGTDYQAADREFIAVRSYVHRLGLAQPGPGVRQGWRFVGEIKGSRHWGLDGNSCAVVQRMSEPLIDQPELSLD